MTRLASTLTGFSAILLWSLLALFTAASGKVPPFQLMAMTFALGGMIGVVSWIFRPHAIRELHQPISVWLLGVGGLFGYHFFYFTALKNAPPIEAGLIAYLWPLLIILFSSLLPGERLRWYHLVGGILGLSGAALIVTGGSSVDFNAEYTLGYSAALLCALIWSAYSVTLRRFSAVSTDVVTGFCLATALCALIAHGIMEETVWPASTSEWLAVFGLGLGPVGLAFYTWDYGMKHGDINVLGAGSYLAPLLSSLALVAAGFADFSWAIGTACVLITLGAVIAAKDMIRFNMPGFKANRGNDQTT